MLNLSHFKSYWKRNKQGLAPGKGSSSCQKSNKLRDCNSSRAHPISKRITDRRAIPSKWARLERSATISDPIRRAQEYIQIHVGEIRTLDELSYIAGLSPSRFAHRFRQEVGEPPWTFVRRIRAEQARKQLESGKKPVDVAVETGYADQAHLTREMQTRYGRTPVELMRSVNHSQEKAAEDSSSVQDL